MPPSAWIYILTNGRHTTLYVGCTNDIATRLWEHRTKRNPNSFTSRYNVFKLEVSSEFFHEQIGEVPLELTICYNGTYPNLSYIKDVNLSIVQARTGIVVSSIFIAFISLLYVFAKRDYWIRKYHEFFKKLQ